MLLSFLVLGNKLMIEMLSKFAQFILNIYV